MSEPVMAQASPFPIEVEAGRRYFWCACGRSAKQPFCDGAHKGTGLTPLPFVPEKDGKLFFCGCKATGKSPLCDGSHKRI